MDSRKGFGYGNYSGVGKVREKNEDYYGYFDTDKGQLFVVCDGMGGHKGGQRASRLAVESIREYVASSVEIEPKVFLRRAIEKANTAVFSEASSNPELQGMGTTCVLLLVRPGSKPQTWVAHVGDSRIYRIRRGEITRVTKDHSKVQKMVDMGIISANEAADHPQKNVITKAIGIEEQVYPDIGTLESFKGDRYVLCTDGITDLISDADIARHSNDKNPQELAEDLVALSDERGGYDNATIQVVDITRGKRPPRPKADLSKKSKLRAGVIASAGVILIIAAFLLWDTLSPGPGREDEDSISAVDTLESEADSTDAGDDDLLVPPHSQASNDTAGRQDTAGVNADSGLAGGEDTLSGVDSVSADQDTTDSSSQVFRLESESLQQSGSPEEPNSTRQ